MSKQIIVFIFSVIFFWGCNQSQSPQRKIIVKEGMVWIPNGVFQMGANSEEARKDEYPQHPVQVDGFWMDQTEVTNAEFKNLLKQQVISLRPRSPQIGKK